jgi:hypothetical protein
MQINLRIYYTVLHAMRVVTNTWDKLEHTYQPRCVYTANKLVIPVREIHCVVSTLPTVQRATIVYSRFTNYKRNQPPCSLRNNFFSSNCFHLD